MIGYRDKTWCTYDSCAKSCTCSDRFRHSDHVKATKWWGNEDYPIWQYTEKPDCYVLDGEVDDCPPSTDCGQEKQDD